MKLIIEKLINGGNGMGVCDGKRIFVPYSAPKDVLEVEISSDHASYQEACIKKIIKPAPCRVKPLCPVFGKCGGCQWQHINYDEQLKWKQAILVETLERVGQISKPIVLETLASPKQWHYRNRMQLHVDSCGRVGYYRPRSKEVVEFESCFIADETLNRELVERRQGISKRSKGIALRTGTEESFSQVNASQNINLRKLLCDWLLDVPHSKVCELYAGSGNFTISIAQIADHVIASEIDKRAVKFAAEKMAGAGISNVNFACMPAEKAVNLHAAHSDVVVIDPPRKGCAEVSTAIAKACPLSILYISCDPATLARDVKTLSEHGYRHVHTKPVDMFPQTFHIESLTLLKHI
ncbi:MAG: class I SAM-dependent RNA methyltransferase [Pseudomonadota bacterium]